MEKRGAISVMELIVWTIPILIAAAIVIFIVTGGLGKGSSFFDTLFGGFEDCDNDNLPNKEDYCPCQSQGTSSSETYAGCPVGVAPPGDLSGALTVKSDGTFRCMPEACKKAANE
ncbi:hypothetical protein J4417_01420 [Candidatus Woesearchaeota archaeon]|nr:hypothetical protein [Candidatus Woesearchaeota archaeon]